MDIIQRQSDENENQGYKQEPDQNSFFLSLGAQTVRHIFSPPASIFQTLGVHQNSEKPVVTSFPQHFASKKSTQDLKSRETHIRIKAIRYNVSVINKARSSIEAEVNQTQQ